MDPMLLIMTVLICYALGLMKSKLNYKIPIIKIKHFYISYQLRSSHESRKGSLHFTETYFYKNT